MYREIIERFVQNHRWAMLIICIVSTIAWYAGCESEVGTILFTEICLLLFVLWLSYAIGVKSKFMGSKIMKYFGGISMEMYLSHMIMFRVLEKLDMLYIVGDGWIGFIFTWIADVFLLVIFIEGYKKFSNIWENKMQGFIRQ